AKRAANDISSQGQRKAGYLLPPTSKVDDAMQAGLVICQLAFVNDESGFVFAFEYLWDDLIEGHDFGIDSRSEKLKCEVSCGQLARHGDELLFDLTLREGARRDDHWAITFAYTASAGEQRIFFLNVRVGVERDRGDVVDSFMRLLVQRLNV